MFNNLKKLLLVSIVHFFLVVIIFFYYITGQKLFIYTDTAQDMYLNIFPNLYYFAKNIDFFSLPTWSHSFGMGMSIFSGSLIRTSIFDPFVQLAIWIGPENLYYSCLLYTSDAADE